MKPIFSLRLSGLPKVTVGNEMVLAATAAVLPALMKSRLLDFSFMVLVEILDGYLLHGNACFWP
jgi:hypothetical protein